MVATDIGRAVLACVRLADKDGRVVLVCVRLVEEDSGFSGWQRPGPCRVGPRFQRSSSTSARRVQQNTGTQLLVEILQERKKAGGAIQGGRGLVDGIAGREDERPLPERLAAPGTVPCRVPFLAFLIHQRSAPHSAGGGQSWRSWPGVWATLRSTRRLRGGAAPRPPVRARGHSAIP